MNLSTVYIYLNFDIFSTLSLCNISSIYDFDVLMLVVMTGSSTPRWWPVHKWYNKSIQVSGGTLGRWCLIYICQRSYLDLEVYIIACRLETLSVMNICKCCLSTYKHELQFVLVWTIFSFCSFLNMFQPKIFFWENMWLNILIFCIV